MSGNQWFALSVRAKHEYAVAKHLEAKDYNVFVPSFRTRHQWSDRIKTVDCPLFPTYIFCQLDLSMRTGTVLATPGVNRILGRGSTPEPVADTEIGAIQRIVESQLPAGPWPYLKTGTKIQIRSGPLSGMEGVIVRLQSELALIVSVSLLQRSVGVQIDPAWVTIVNDISNAAGPSWTPVNVPEAARMRVSGNNGSLLSMARRIQSTRREA